MKLSQAVDFLIEAGADLATPESEVFSAALALARYRLGQCEPHATVSAERITRGLLETLADYASAGKDRRAEILAERADARRRQEVFAAALAADRRQRAQEILAQIAASPPIWWTRKDQNRWVGYTSPEIPCYELIRRRRNSWRLGYRSSEDRWFRNLARYDSQEVAQAGATAHCEQSSAA